mmetsp:Transcript_22929/g.52931  ORF Transcript_22929/g.52931 Transcript_22929/m.52931 type:complete len:205 (+) Transcript_22929:430-1044(+)
MRSTNQTPNQPSNQSMARCGRASVQQCPPSHQIMRAHLLGEAGLLDGRDRIAAADDGAAAGTRELGERVSNIERALGESLELEYAHRAVPDDGLAVGELLLDHLGRLGAVVEPHPALWNRLDRDGLCSGIGGELVRDNNVRRQDEIDALLGRDLLELAGELELVLLNERRSRLEAARLEESEDHATADDDLVHLLHERLNHADL